jgi:putative transposase
LVLGAVPARSPRSLGPRYGADGRTAAPGRTSGVAPTNPFFTEKVRDIVGLYMNPPDNAVVLCVDEKPTVQAVERTQPVLPMVFGQSSRATATYQRHGITNLFEALNVATGKVIGACFPDKRAVEFRLFLLRGRHDFRTRKDRHRRSAQVLSAH